MKNPYLLIILVLIPCMTIRATGQSRVIEYPVYDARTSAIPTISRIELTDTTTRLHIHCTYIPDDWVEFSEKTFIQPDPDGEKYYALGIEGGAFRTHITLPASGDTSIVLIFPTLAAGVKTINYGADETTFIYGISLSHGSEGPSSDKMVPDSVQKWIDNELANAKIKTLTNYGSTDFFRRDTARLIGYLQGYHPRLGFSSGIIYAHNVLTNEDFPLVVAIHPDGKFEVDLPMNYPLYTYVSFNNKVSYFYIEPGQSLAMILDWDDFLKAGWGKSNSSRTIKPLQFIGPASRINSELATIELQTPSYREMSEKVKTLVPERFKELHLAAWKANEAALEKDLASRDLMPQTKTILRNELTLAHANYMYDYEMNREYEQSQDSVNKVLKVNSDSTFYDFLGELPLNEPSLLISSEFSTFINRYEFGDAFVKAYSLASREKTSSTVERYLKVWKIRDSILTGYYKLQPNLVHEISKTRTLKHIFQQIFEDKKDEARRFLTGLSAGISNPFLQEESERYFRKIYTSTRQTAYTLPPGKATDIFNRIISPHKGKVLFIDFWATSCAPCVAFIRKHKTERLKYNDNPDFDFIFITAVNESPETSYQNFIKENEMEHSYRISADDYRYLRQLFKFNGIPRYVLVGKDGRILNDDFPMYNFKYELPKILPRYQINL